LYRGRFFGFEFNKPPTPLKDGAEILKVEVLFDPMTPTTDQAKLRNQLRATIDATLPAESLDLVEDREGATINGWRIYDLAHIRKVVQPDRNYYLLAEKEGKGAIAVAEEDQSGELYYLDNENDLPVKVGKSLQSFIG
jgi:hypothetical protein